MTITLKHGDGGLAEREKIRALPRYALTKRERRAPITTPRGLEFMLLNRARLYRVNVQQRGWSALRSEWIAKARIAVSDSAEYRAAPVLP